MPKAEPHGYGLRIELEGVTPAVWRLVEFPPNYTLWDIHYLIQDVMPWDDEHLHLFTIKGVKYGPVGYDLDCEDEEKVLFGDVFTRKGAKGKYLYDFGDSWAHTLTYMGPSARPVARPRLLDGRRNAPPENSGGHWGYAHKLTVLADEKHPDHAFIREWMGDGFDPEALDIDGINKWLQS